MLAIDYADEAPLGTLGVNAYAYPYIGGELLDSVLPYLTYLTPFTYGITPAGVLAPLDDARLLERAAHYGAKSLMHLSTLTPEEISSENAAALLQNDRAQSALLAEILQTMAKKGYCGLDVDFEYVPPELREDYAAFVCRMREALNTEGKPVVAALAPKTSAQQRGLLYEGARLRAAVKSRERRVPDDLRMGLCLRRAAGHRAAAAGVRGARLRALGHGENIFLARRCTLRLAAALQEKKAARGPRRSRRKRQSPRARLVGAEIEFDETARSPYYHYFDKMRREHAVWFEDARSLRAKSPSRRKRACRASASGRRGGSSRRRGRCSTRC